MAPLSPTLLLLTTTTLTTAFLLPPSTTTTTPTTTPLLVLYNQRPYEKSGFGEGGRRKARPPPPKVTQDPEKRISLLNRKLNEVIKLEAMEWEDLNDQQREKLKRKEELKKEISDLSRNLKREEFLSEGEKKRAEAPSAADLEDDLVGGKIPRTLLKLLVYCRVSDSGTCKILLELGKVKVNGEVVDDEVMKVDLVKDKIEFDGEEVTLPDNRLKPWLRRGNGEEQEEEDVPTKYCARIDGGLLIDLTRNREKERGTYIDKSPYIFKKERGSGSGSSSGGGWGGSRGGSSFGRRQGGSFNPPPSRRGGGAGGGGSGGGRRGGE